MKMKTNEKVDSVDKKVGSQGIRLEISRWFDKSIRMQQIILRDSRFMAFFDQQRSSLH